MNLEIITNRFGTDHEQITNRTQTELLCAEIAPQQLRILSPSTLLYIVDTYINLINQRFVFTSLTQVLMVSSGQVGRVTVRLY